MTICRATLAPELVDLAVRGASLAERIELGWAGDASREATRTAELMAAWREGVAAGDPTLWALRLGTLGLDDARALALLAHPPEAPGRPVPLPSWIDTLGGLLEHDRTRPPGPGVPIVDPEGPTPFGEVLLPLVDFARERLRARAGEQLERFTGEGERDLALGLARRLFEISRRVLTAEWKTFRMVLQDALDKVVLSPLESPERVLYDTFVGEWALSGRLARAYPALARLIAVVIDDWVDGAVELVERLDADLPAIAAAFGGGGDPGAVSGVQTGLSDPHRGGRMVSILTFGSGLRVVYKPKDLSVDAAFANLVGWLNERGASPALDAAPVLVRPGYGWMAYVAAERCPDRAAVARYFERAGMFVVLTYVLEGTDGHSGNLIARGEHPVLLDLETLVHPHRSDVGAQEESAESRADERMWRSVLRPGLLLDWWVDARGGLHDSAGFGVTDAADRIVPVWQGIGTNEMELVEQERALRPRPNAPRLQEGKPLHAYDFQPAFERGFRSLWTLLAGEAPALLAGDGPLAAFRAVPVRALLRDTTFYYRMLSASLAPTRLRSGLARSFYLEGAFRPYLIHPLLGWLLPTARSEVLALERGDIPYFWTTSEAEGLWLEDGGWLPGVYREGSWECVRANLGALGEDELELQLSFVRAAFRAYRAVARSGSAAAEPVDVPVVDGPAPGPRELIALAERIGARMAAAALRAPGGAITWIALEQAFDSHVPRLAPMGMHLYSGRAGVALFLAALARVTMDRANGKLALGALLEWRRGLREQGGAALRRAPLGGFTGVGSLIYVLVRMGDLLEASRGGAGSKAKLLDATTLLDPDGLLDDAACAASWITDQKIADDHRLDFIAGSAGAIRPLLLLHERTGDPAWLERAAACGRRLLAARVPVEGGLRVWPTMGRSVLTGLGHGVAGIALPLLSLAAATGDESFRRAALDGVAWERAVFDVEEGNWPDFRSGPNGKPGGRAFMLGWCAGAPGIGFARIETLRLLDDEAVRDELEAAIRATVAAGVLGTDDLCCGAMGRTQFLFEAGRALNRSELVERARQQAAAVANRALEASDHPFGVVSLMKGTAGIGMALLRMAAPDVVPNALVLG